MKMCTSGGARCGMSTLCSSASSSTRHARSRSMFFWAKVGVRVVSGRRASLKQQKPINPRRWDSATLLFPKPPTPAPRSPFPPPLPLAFPARRSLAWPSLLCTALAWSPGSCLVARTPARLALSDLDGAQAEAGNGHLNKRLPPGRLARRQCRRRRPLQQNVAALGNILLAEPAAAAATSPQGGGERRCTVELARRVPMCVEERLHASAGDGSHGGHGKRERRKGKTGDETRCATVG